METLTEIPVRKIPRSRLSEVDFSNLEFGTITSDHMLICDYANGDWQMPQIVPFANMSINPSSLALHYGQTVFEGMKAFRMKDGRINIFRIEKHYQRFAKSLERMCMAVVPKDVFVDGLVQLISLDHLWVPEDGNAALYIRPFVYANEARFGIAVSQEYRFIIFTGPVPSLYSEPIKVKVETNYIRAGKGGTGAAKCGGNYGGSLLPTKNAREQGYDQVLWTDSKENKFIEESGMMNVMFVIDDTIITPPVSDSILDGVTRDSILTIAKQLGFPTIEKQISLEKLTAAFTEGSITAAFGVGTAAVIAPISVINIEGIDYHLPAYRDGNILSLLKSRLNGIRVGDFNDSEGWNFVI